MEVIPFLIFNTLEKQQLHQFELYFRLLIELYVIERLVIVASQFLAP